MLNVTVDKIGELAVVRCEGRIVQSDSAYKLLEAVTSLTDARIVVLELIGGERHRRRRLWYARISATMGTRKQHPIPTVQSIRISPERIETCHIDCRILHPFIRGNDGPSGVCQK